MTPWKRSLRVLALSAPLWAGGVLAQGTGAGPQPSRPGRGPPAECPCPMMGPMQGGTGGAGMAGTCPMARAGVDVTVEETAQGATLRLRARDPAQAEQVQRMARHMEQCMEARAAPAPQGQTPPER